MVVAVIVSTVVVVAHHIKKKAFDVLGCLAVSTFDLGDSLGDCTLDDVRAAIREVVRTSHPRIRQAEELLESLLEMEQTYPVQVCFCTLSNDIGGFGANAVEISVVHQCFDEDTREERMAFFALEPLDRLNKVSFPSI